MRWRRARVCALRGGRRSARAKKSVWRDPRDKTRAREMGAAATQAHVREVIMMCMGATRLSHTRRRQSVGGGGRRRHACKMRKLGQSCCYTPLRAMSIFRRSSSPRTPSGRAHHEYAARSWEHLRAAVATSASAVGERGAASARLSLGAQLAARRRREQALSLHPSPPPPNPMVVVVGGGTLWLPIVVAGGGGCGAAVAARRGARRWLCLLARQAARDHRLAP